MHWKKLLFPPLGFTLLLSLACAAALVYVFVNELEQSWLAYTLYAASTYALSILCAACVKGGPAMYKSIKASLYKNRHIRRYYKDVVFRTHVSLYRSLTLNLLYALANAVFAVFYSSNWFGIFAVYYAILAIVRFILLNYVNRKGIGISRLEELARTRICSYVLLSINLVLSGAVLMMVSFRRGFEYPGMLIYLVALYTFYTTTAAIVDLVKYRKYKSPVMSATKMIKLAAALVSMLSLETAMFAQFGADKSPENHTLMLALTGAGVSVAVSTMALYMIFRINKEVRSIRTNG